MVILHSWDHPNCYFNNGVMFSILSHSFSTTCYFLNFLQSLRCRVVNCFVYARLGMSGATMPQITQHFPHRGGHACSSTMGRWCDSGVVWEAVLLGRKALVQWESAKGLERLTDSRMTNDGAADPGARAALAYIPVAILMCAIISYIDLITVDQ